MPFFLGVGQNSLYEAIIPRPAANTMFITSWLIRKYSDSGEAAPVDQIGSLIDLGAPGAS